MSSSVAAPRSVTYTAGDFTAILSREYDVFDVSGKGVRISCDAFVTHSEVLLEALKGRVEVFQRAPGKLSPEQVAVGRGLLLQYQQFQALVLNVELVAEELMDKAGFFDTRYGNGFFGASKIQCKGDVPVIAAGYKVRMSQIRHKYFTTAVLEKGYLADLIKELTERLSKV